MSCQNNLQDTFQDAIRSGRLTIIFGHRQINYYLGDDDRQFRLYFFGL